jgi:secretion/DNA translocation related TadE-like protein
MSLGAVEGPSPSDRGSGSLLAIGLVAAIAVLTSLLVPLHSALAVRSLVGAAADSAALAAADVAVGLTPGIPCEAAARAASAAGAQLASCAVDGLVVTVVASRGILGVDVTAAATAGPPSAG